MRVEGQQSVCLDFAALMVQRSVVFPVEHILERVKLESQKHPEKASKVSIKELWQLKGIKGLYEGSVANFTKRFVKDLYQLPLTFALNKFWKGHLPEKYNKDNLGANLLTGFSVATFVQSGITLPIERVFIEKTTKEGYNSFFKKLENEGALKRISILYEGYQATLLRHSFVWTTFFLSNHAASHLIKRVDSKDQHPSMSWFARGFFTGTTVVAAGYPLEFLRNRILMEPEVLSKGTINAVKTLCKRYGLKVLYSGSPIMLIHNCIQTFFLQTFFDKMNKK